MYKKLLIVVFMFASSISMAQSTYDSLRSVYSIREVFTKRKELNISYSKFVDTELQRITNPKIKQLVMCAFVENLYEVPFLTDNELMNMINDVLKKPASDEIQNRALGIKSELTREVVGTIVKPLAFPTINGDTIKLVDVSSSGKDYVVIDFWATWCGPCVASMKKFNALKEKYNIEFFSVSLDDKIDKVQKFMAKNPSYTWPIVYGGREAGLHSYFKIRAIPAYFIVDKKGLIVATVVGGEPERELKKLYKK